MNMKQAAELVLVLAEKKGLKDVDVVVERSEALDVEIQEGKVEKVEQSTSLGLGVRVLDGGRTGLASTERLSSESIQHAFENACENAKLQDPTEVKMLDAPAEIPDSASLELYNPELDQLNTEDLTELGLSIEDAVKAADKRVVSIPYLGVSRGSNESLLLSSRGVFTNSSQMKLPPGADRFYRMEIPENPECRFFTAGTGIRMQETELAPKQ